MSDKSAGDNWSEKRGAKQSTRTPHEMMTMKGGFKKYDPDENVRMGPDDYFLNEEKYMIENVSSKDKGFSYKFNMNQEQRKNPLLQEMMIMNTSTAIMSEMKMHE